MMRARVLAERLGRSHRCCAVVVAAGLSIAATIVSAGTQTQADIDALRAQRIALDNSLIDLEKEKSLVNQACYDRWQKALADARAERAQAEKAKGDAAVDIQYHTDSGQPASQLCDVLQAKRAGKRVSPVEWANHVNHVAEENRLFNAKKIEFARVDTEVSGLKIQPPCSDAQRITQQIDATNMRIRALGADINALTLQVRAAEKKQDDTDRAKTKTQEERDRLDQDRAKRDRLRLSANDEDREIEQRVAEVSASANVRAERMPNKDDNGGGSNVVVDSNLPDTGGATKDGPAAPAPAPSVIGRLFQNFSLIPSASAAEIDSSPTTLPPLKAGPPTADQARGSIGTDEDGMPAAAIPPGAADAAAAQTVGPLDPQNPQDRPTLKVAGDFAQDQEVGGALESAVNKALGPDAAAAADKAFYLGVDSAPSRDPDAGLPVENNTIRIAVNQRLAKWLPSSVPRVGGSIQSDSSHSALNRVQSAADYATIHVSDAEFGIGRCAHYVADAIAASTGVTLKPPDGGRARDYGSPLLSAGFTQLPVPADGQYDFKKGDVIVMEPRPGRIDKNKDAGHIEIYNGTQWVSDFVQSNGIWPSSKDAAAKPGYRVYRMP